MAVSPRRFPGLLENEELRCTRAVMMITSAANQTPLSWSGGACMKLGAVVLLIVVGSAATIAGAPISGLTPDQANVDALMLYHWWTSSSEAAAVSALVDVFKKQYPEVAVRPTTADSQGGGSKMFGVISGAAATGRPPDAFQVHAGAPIRPYFDAGLLNPIDEVWTVRGSRRRFRPSSRR